MTLLQKLAAPVVIASFLVLGVAASASAQTPPRTAFEETVLRYSNRFHDSAPSLSKLGHAQCAGSHCTLVGFWSRWLHATLHLDAMIEPLAEPPICEAGATFDLDIAATGELTGKALAFFGTPPITFFDDGLFEAQTKGIAQHACIGLDRASCSVFTGEAAIRQGHAAWRDSLPWGNDIVPSQHVMDQLFHFLGRPLLGRWTDAWAAQNAAGTSPLICNTLGAHGARCRFTSDAHGPQTITLTRSVADIALILDTRLVSTVPPAQRFAYWSEAKDVNYDRVLRVANPRLVSSLTFDCPGAPPQPLPSPSPSASPSPSPAPSVKPSPSPSPEPPEKHFPNLAVINVINVPPKPVAGEPMAFEADIISNGTADVVPGTAAILKLDFNADGAWDQTLAPHPVPPLPRDASHHVAWFDAWTAAEGTHRYQICVDPTNAIAELSETDNCVTRTIVVDPAPPAALVKSPAPVVGTVSAPQPGPVRERE